MSPYHILGWSAIVLVVGLFGISAVVSFIRERGFRKRIIGRQVIPLEQWISVHFAELEQQAEVECIKKVLNALGEAYGVPATCLRPDDEINEDYGSLNPLILDRPLARAIESLDDPLRNAILSRSIRLVKRATVSDIIRRACSVARSNAARS